MYSTLRRSVLIAFLVWGTALFVGSSAWAIPSFFSSSCAGCHNNDTPTCNGCHHHRGSLSATKDQSQYFPGQTVTVTLNGGTQSGWIRGLLYDQNDVEIARRTGPTGMGDDGQGNPVVFPVQMQAPAPMSPGSYVWKAAWFGNWNDGGSVHNEQRVNVTITVVADPSDAPDDGGASFVQRSWSRLKRQFSH